MEVDVEDRARRGNRSPEPVFDVANLKAHVVQMPPGTPVGFPVAETYA